MRTIKFRAKSKSTKQWVYGYIREIWASKQEDCRYVMCPSMSFEENGWTDIEETEVIPETIGQFTGAIDCSGKQIFENDIIFNEDRMQHQVVFYDEERFCFFCKYVGCEETVSLCNSIGNVNYKVGNIFDNADLVSF